MENDVTSLKTSRLLEAAKFPIDPELAWYPDQNETYATDEVEDEDWFVAQYGGEERCVRAYTTQDIVDQLRDKMYNNLSIWARDSGYEMRLQLPDGDIESAGVTWAEALAALWLKLQEASHE